MKKMLVRVLAMTLVIMTVFSLGSVAFAAKVSSVSQTSDADGDCRKTFYVKTNSSIFSKKLKMTMTKGTLGVKIFKSSSVTADFVKSVPDSYEITIWYWNASTGKWVLEQNYDIYCKTSDTITLKKANTYYKILVDSYSAKTAVKSYVKSGKITWSAYTLGSFDGMFNEHAYYWKATPKWTIKNSQNCTLYNSNPIQ